MKTIKEVISLSEDYLAKAGFCSPRVDAEWLIGHALNLSRMELYLKFDKPLNENELGKIRPLISRRAKGEPVQYICGSTEFYGLELSVGEGVLVPRPETESLVDTALKKCNDNSDVLDLCTGSGAIAIAIKKNKPSVNMTAVDISNEALSYAIKNSESLQADIEFLEGNLLSPVSGRLFDVITVNPPYVKNTERHLMGKDVLQHEPELALFAGDDGMDILNILAQEAKSFLKQGGFFISEIGFTQGNACLQIFKANGWSDVQIQKDLSGKDRFVLCFKA